MKLPAKPEITTEQMVDVLRKAVFANSIDNGVAAHIAGRLAECDVLKVERDERLADIEAAMYWRARAEKAEAELAAARPLLEAVSSSSQSELYPDKQFRGGDEERILRAALAYRQAKEKK